jgi:PadR family transcriptional regulator, regulatory protein PadR
MSEVRVTIAVARVLRAFLDDIDKARYGYDLMRETGFPSGKLYPILARLQKAGWLVREREVIDPAAERRPARTLYRLSAPGVAAARQELAALAAEFGQPAPLPAGRPRPAPGRA